MIQNCVRSFALSLLCVAAGLSQITLNQAPSRTVGHPKTPTPEQLAVASNNPDLIEGRELFQPSGLALDTTTTPPIIYVSDTWNNRVLGWKNASGFTNGQPADLIIGQPDAFSTNPQGPGRAKSTGFTLPTGLAVDSKGNLYVADSGNNRVLRFPKPFAQPSQVPDLVVGQPSFQTRTANFNQGTATISARGIRTEGLVTNMAFDGAGNLFVADPGNRRVLAFQASDLNANGPTPYLELGQLDFTSAQPVLGSSNAASAVVANQFAVPSSLEFDSKGRLYVTDADPNGGFLSGRILVFSPPFRNGGAASRIYGVFQPGSVTPSQMQQDHVLMIDPEGVFPSARRQRGHGGQRQQPHIDLRLAR
jgi:sugar lactone lactonase YvrE